jgi:aminoglycoside phosphotransferase (APT) family kinase protein
MRPTEALPDDPALPALAVIREAGLARALPMLGLGDQPIVLRLSGYTAGSRATIEAQAGDRHFALKLYADDPAPEADLYHALAAAGFAGDTGPRAPRLLAVARELRVLVISWLEGEPANRLIKSGRGRRAGELAAAFLWRLATLPIRLGPSFGPGDLLYDVGRSVAELSAAAAAVGDAATRVAKVLKGTQPKNGHPRLVHGTLYARHILDLGDGQGPGVIDWQRYGQGPVEVDAGMFLATVTRLGLRHARDAREAVQAEQAFLDRTQGLVDERTLAWYRAASLLHLAGRGLRRQPAALARTLVDEAARLAEGRVPVVPPPSLSLAAGVPGRSALELVLAALSATPATPAELDEIQALLDKKRQLG